MTLIFNIDLNFHKFDSELLKVFSSGTFGSITFSKYGYTEPLKNKVVGSQDSLLELWNKYLSIIVKGSDSFWFSASAESSGIISCGGGISTKNITEKKIKDLIQFIEYFSVNDCLIYAYLSDEDTYDEKHKLVDEYSYSWKGSSIYDFFEYLPGIYWYTAFGKEYINCIGIEKLENLEGITYTHLEENRIAFHLIEQLDEGKSLLKEIENIEEQIGENYFYSKHRNVENLRHPKGFKEFLKSLKME